MVLHKERLLNYFYSNLIGILGGASILGGSLVFLIYSYHIRYIPEFDLASSVTIISTLSITAAFFLLTIMFVSIAPGVFWDYIWHEFAKSIDLKKYWADLSIPKTLGMLALWFVIPTAVIFFSMMEISVSDHPDLFWLIILAGCFLIFFTSFRGLGVRRSIFEFIIFVVVSGIAACLAFFPVIIFSGLIKSSDLYLDPALKDNIWVINWGIPSLIILFNVLAAAPTPNNTLIVGDLISKRMVKNFCLGFVVVIMTIFVCSIPSVIPTLVMRAYGLGDFPVRKMYLKAEGCSVFSETGAKVFYTKDTNSYGNKKDICCVEDVRFLSRLGSENYIRLYLPEGTKVDVTLPSVYVISWVSDSNNRGKNLDEIKDEYAYKCKVHEGMYEEDNSA